MVFDGLGHRAAGSMSAIAHLRERGACHRTLIGVPTVSRPVYAAISTGLEQDRSGVRSNDDGGPLSAESVWDLARAAGLEVAAISELPWWRELFPRGFSRYQLGEESDDFFAAAPAADLLLIHPLYIDEAGHTHGAASDEYAEAVARADRELAAFLRGLDLTRDLVIVTGDHGHAARGGHGGSQEEIAHVLTCYAGRGVRPAPREGLMRVSAVGPSLALLLGLPFPAHMRAGDDDLDLLWQLLDPAAFPAAYLADRQAALERFRRANADALHAWLPDSQGSWDRFYAAHRRQQRRAALPFAALLALLLGAQALAHRRLGPRSAPLFGLGFVLVFAAVIAALQVGLRGSFDLSSVAGRGEFIAFTLALGLVWTLAAVLAHWTLRRDRAALLLDLAVISAAGTLLSLAHPAVFGWRVGFPAPSPALYFLPYFAALTLAAVNLVALGVLLAFRSALKDMS